MIDELREALTDIVRTAKEFARHHKIVEKNPEELLAADRSGSAVLSTLVGNECAAKMSLYMAAEGELHKAAFTFVQRLAQATVNERYDLARENATRMKLAFVAVRYYMSGYEAYLLGNMHSSRGKPSRESTRYFEEREELIRQAEAYKD